MNERVSDSDSTLPPSLSKTRRLPDVLDNRGTRRDKIPLIDIILLDALWDSERGWTSPSEQFLDQCRDIRQVFLIRELGQALASNNSVQFLLRLSHDVGVEGRDHEEGSQNGVGLPLFEIELGYGCWGYVLTVSAAAVAVP